MESRHARARKSLRLAFIVSLALHGVVLFLHLSQPPGELSGPTAAAPASRFDAVLAPPTPPSFTQSKPAKTNKKNKAAPTKVLTAKGPGSLQRTWSRAERNEMNDFLKELAAPPRPASGAELAQRGRAMARGMGGSGDRDEGDAAISGGGKPIDAFSMEMYFDAFIRKLNRSAAFVKRESRGNGRRKALVQIILNADGTLQSYKVLRAADQELEINFIRSVVERASPFSAFPPDIKSAAKTLTINMCITPQGGGSDGFVRMGSGDACRD